MRFYVGIILLVTLAAFASAVTDKEKCQAKANKTKSGVWGAIDSFCGSFGDRLPTYNEPRRMTGYVFFGPTYTTAAYIQPKYCKGAVPWLYKQGCYDQFYSVCAAGGQKGRGEKGFGPGGCLKVGLKSI